VHIEGVAKPAVIDLSSYGPGGRNHVRTAAEHYVKDIAREGLWVRDDLWYPPARIQHAQFVYEPQEETP
jgi:hypothetical protein